MGGLSTDLWQSVRLTVELAAITTMILLLIGVPIKSRITVVIAASPMVSQTACQRSAGRPPISISFVRRARNRIFR